MEEEQGSEHVDVSNKCDATEVEPDITSEDPTFYVMAPI